jgi:hypothetical protein
MTNGAGAPGHGLSIVMGRSTLVRRRVQSQPRQSAAPVSYGGRGAGRHGSDPELSNRGAPRAMQARLTPSPLPRWRRIHEGRADRLAALLAVRADCLFQLVNLTSCLLFRPDRGNGDVRHLQVFGDLPVAFLRRLAELRGDKVRRSSTSRPHRPRSRG